MLPNGQNCSGFLNLGIISEMLCWRAAPSLCTTSYLLTCVEPIKHRWWVHPWAGCPVSVSAWSDRKIYPPPTHPAVMEGIRKCYELFQNKSECIMLENLETLRKPFVGFIDSNWPSETMEYEFRNLYIFWRYEVCLEAATRWNIILKRWL